ncbi:MULTISPECIES: hypothetical protein [unclassified Streptomyces]|uniref:hypothetical protein n=1 Tax=unclassified Streptomyces TaxID=2593676 RepID=UPI00081F31A8|nr:MULTISPECIES: hypothetical protein [unclassified Streptomyces]MYR26907.1 hypothetical protein [Streptomyces sp. SID4945]SCF13595.1 hypothetical protein GA0115257_107279 [Streptomyces sp. LcepLS]
MTEREHVFVNDPRGPVNSGAGGQYIFYGLGTEWMTRRGVEPLRLVREDRERLADRFVPPRYYRHAADRLEKPGSVVLLDATPGSGRRAAAIMLLHELGKEGRTAGDEARFEELPAAEKDEGPFSPGEGERFLLDLSGITDEETYARAQHRLALRRSQVQEAGAHMAVVLPAGMEHVHTWDLDAYTVRLGRPRGVAVVTRHLRMDRLAFRSADLADPGLQSLCQRSPMREVARLAGLVRTARDSGRFGTDFAGWLDQAMHAVSDRAAEVGRQVAEVRTAPERALLLAVAVFEEAGADVVHEAWQSLMRTVRHEEEETTELARIDYGERLAGLGIERGSDGRLRFGRLAYADAVRTYFWANFPGMRGDLRDWIGHASGLRGLTTDDRVNAVVRFGERVLAVERPDHLFGLVTRWADGAAGMSCEPRALAALELGLTHERFGGWFRRRMYECARSGSLTDGLARVLTAACLQSLRTTHPEQALVRLHYLALREGEAAHEAREALLGLASEDRSVHRKLIGRLRERVHQVHQPGLHLRLLTELLGKDRTPDPAPWPDLYRGWATVFSQPPTEWWKPLVNGWLNAAAGDTGQRMALRVMVGAASEHLPALQRLYAIACTWADSGRHASREAVAALFWQYIDEAQDARAGSTDAGPQTTEEAR